MKLSIFGATGRTGKHLLEQALGKGYQVQALVRTRSKLGPVDRNLSVVEGDVRDPQCVAAAISGVDAVISVLGPTNNSPEYMVSQGMEYILSAMQQHRVHRLILSTGAGVGDPEDAPTLINHLISGLLKLTSKYVYEDMHRTADLARKSDRDWTIVRAPMLTDGPRTGKIRVGYVGKGTGVRLSRADLAAFMLDQLATQTYSRKAPMISN